MIEHIIVQMEAVLLSFIQELVAQTVVKPRTKAPRSAQLRCANRIDKFRGQPVPFVMELPNYRLPAKSVARLVG